MRAEWVETNRAWWDERTPIHVASEFYDLAGFIVKSGRDIYRMPEGMPRLPLMYSLRARKSG